MLDYYIGLPYAAMHQLKLLTKRDYMHQALQLLTKRDYMYQALQLTVAKHRFSFVIEFYLFFIIDS
jgi:hypothetical protein